MAKVFEVFYDAACPLCRREIELIRSMDRQKRLVFTDISSADWQSSKDVGKSFSELMAEIHGRYLSGPRKGELVQGVEVFRQLYACTMFRFLVPITRLWIVSQVLDLAYVWFAKRRLNWTGRCSLEGCKISA